MQVREEPSDLHTRRPPTQNDIGGGADKSVARPGRKQATLTKLGIYSTYSPRRSETCIPDGHYTQRYIPDDVSIKLSHLMMSTGLLETCREVK